MQKYVDLKELGTRLQIISAFVVEHVKGFVFVEAEKQSDVVEVSFWFTLSSGLLFAQAYGLINCEFADMRSLILCQACHQLADVYYSLVTRVPVNEVSQLLVVRRRYNEVKEGTWARVKSGIYRGDIAQVIR